MIITISIDRSQGVTTILAQHLCEPESACKTMSTLCRYRVTTEENLDFKKVISVQCAPALRSMRVVQKAVEAVGLS